MNQKRIMALDVGDARVGVALTDPLGLMAHPLCTVEKTGKKLVQALVKLCEENEIGEIVIGLPLEMSGEAGAQAEKVKAFAARFKSALGQRPQLREVEVHFWDERLTTAQAERVLAGSGLKNREKSSALDRVAATLILESFLNSR